MIRKALLTLTFAAVCGQAKADCAGEPGPCLLSDGEYHIALPENKSDRPAAIIFLHGAGSSGDSYFKNRGMVNAFTNRGYAFIAPTGGRSFRGRANANWVFFPGWEGRDETDFLKRVADDAASRFGIDRDRIILSGFSAGGFMVNYLACDAPGAFAAYAPVSGGFWRPHPQACSGPVKLFHTHGWTDSTVPIEGRPLRNGEFLQGDIFAGLEIWRNANACAGHNPSSYTETGQFWRRKWDRCDPDSALEFALFPGGHGVPRGWANMALDWFEDVVPRPQATQ